MGILQKKNLLSLVIQEIERERQTLVQAALIAREAATHEESIAEDKYDTRGLEASYLAGAQAKRAKELEKLIFDLQNFSLKDQSQIENVEVGAIVEILQSGKNAFVFILPFAGGIQVKESGKVFQTLTPASPLGQELLGRSREDEFEIKVGPKTQEVEILNFY